MAKLRTTRKKKKAKVPSVRTLKKRLWKIFSEYIRSSTADTGGYNACITCGVRTHYKNLQAGHFIPGRHNSILFDERGVHPQCYRCNVPLKGNPRAYDRYMREKYGPDIIAELERIDLQNKQFQPQELLELIAHYKSLLRS